MKFQNEPVRLKWFKVWGLQKTEKSIGGIFLVRPIESSVFYNHWQNCLSNNRQGQINNKNKMSVSSIFARISVEYYVREYDAMLLSVLYTHRI